MRILGVKKIFILLLIIILICCVSCNFNASETSEGEYYVQFLSGIKIQDEYRSYSYAKIKKYTQNNGYIVFELIDGKTIRTVINNVVIYDFMPINEDSIYQ